MEFPAPKQIELLREKNIIASDVSFIIIHTVITPTKKARPRHNWIKKLYETQYGNTSLKEIIFDSTLLNITRMRPEEFNTVCVMLDNKIRKCDTKQSR